MFFRVAPLVLITSLTLAITSKGVYANTLANQLVTVSYYGNGGKDECGRSRPCHGSLTACGDVFNKNHISVANKSLPCGTPVRFCTNGKCVVAKVTDRGPFVRGRHFDLSLGAARYLGIIEQGVAKVKATILKG
ncbi:MAG: septal ring lytic transglycosylase RlpA family protein [Candidatus Pacebacteria bacterium]|jgi:rare lipoprotein A (peptidoglycan hydrolase)|nr:septal ring lytic transglycosylase RlpA family protein [Candidatus Paceibacterota bacterium]